MLVPYGYEPYTCRVDYGRSNVAVNKMLRNGSYGFVSEQAQIRTVTDLYGTNSTDHPPSPRFKKICFYVDFMYEK